MRPKVRMLVQWALPPIKADRQNQVSETNQQPVIMKKLAKVKNDKTKFGDFPFVPFRRKQRKRRQNDENNHKMTKTIIVFSSLSSTREVKIITHLIVSSIQCNTILLNWTLETIKWVITLTGIPVFLWWRSFVWKVYLRWLMWVILVMHFHSFVLFRFMNPFVFTVSV